MDPFPHYSRVDGCAPSTGEIVLKSDGVTDLLSTAPREFGGGGTEWSPEALLVAAVSDCYILTFRSLALESQLEWTNISCHTVGKLERIDEVSRFTQFGLEVVLKAPADTSESMAQRLLEKAKTVCLVTNSLNAECVLSARLSKS